MLPSSFVTSCGDGGGAGVGTTTKFGQRILPFVASSFLSPWPWAVGVGCERFPNATNMMAQAVVTASVRNRFILRVSPHYRPQTHHVLRTPPPDRKSTRLNSSH